MANDEKIVNNAIYNAYGERWYTANDDPVALLRAEGKIKNPWIQSVLNDAFEGKSCRILDVGCGAGFLTNFLALQGHLVAGLDASPESLLIAERRDSTGAVRYQCADAYHLPYENDAFDAVAALDFLEHVEDPHRVVAQISRVLRPGGLFFFHTFNRNALSWLIVIKGVEWFVKNTPPNMHILRLFIKPRELTRMCEESGLAVHQIVGLRPSVNWAFWKMLATGEVPPDFEFRFTPSCITGYIGFARKG